MRKKLLIIVIFLQLIFSSLFAGEVSVLLERVRYCTGWLSNTCMSGGNTPYKFRFWEDNNVGHGDQRKTYITMLSEPSKSSVRNIAVFFAGQQGADFGNNDGVPNVVTGQKDNFKNNCKFGHQSCWRTANEDSLAIRVKNSGIFDMSDTFFAMVYDTAFYFGTTTGNKQDIEDAYYSWLRDKVNYSNLKVVYLGGSSRGGCLALRLAKRFKSDFPNGNVKVVVSVIDPVCKKGQNEMGATGSEDQNPLTNDDYYHGWHSDLNAQFPNKHGLYIYSVLGGDRVITLSAAHCVSYGEEEHKELGWYRHDWVLEEHSTMGRNYETTLDDSNTRIVSAQLAFAKEKILEQEFVVGDFDGDGKDELIKIREFMETMDFNNGSWVNIWKNEGEQTNIAPYRKMIAGDFDGDGKDEIFAYGGWTTMFSYNNGTWNWGWSNYGSNSGISAYSKFIAGDFDGDGKDEIFAYSDGTWKTMFKYYNGTWNWAWSNYGNSGGITPYSKFVVGDFDGDNKDEIFAYSETSTWRTIFNYENGNMQWGWSNQGSGSTADYNNFIAGDFDGDGKVDLISTSGWTTIFKYYNGTWNWAWSNYGNSNLVISPYKYLLPANLDSDSSDELITLYSDNKVLEYENNSWIYYTPETTTPIDPIEKLEKRIDTIR